MIRFLLVFSAVLFLFVSAAFAFPRLFVMPAPDWIKIPAPMPGMQPDAVNELPSRSVSDQGRDTHRAVKMLVARHRLFATSA